MASIEKRGDGYRVRIRHQGFPDESQTFDTLARARAWAARREGEIADGRAGILPRKTVRDAVKRYIDGESTLHRGHRWEQIRLHKIMRNAEFADRQIAALTSDDIARWRDSLLRTLATSSARREYGLLRRVFKLATIEWKWLRESPFAGVRPPAPGDPRGQRVSDAEAIAIAGRLGYEVGRPETISQFVAVAFLLAIQTALRKGELLRLVRADVRASERVLHVRKSKNGQARDVPLSKAALALLELLPEKDELFPVTPGSCDTLFRRARKEAGFDTVHFHDSRREATTRLASKLDVLTLAKVTGHRDINLLNRVYYAPRMTDVAELLD